MVTLYICFANGKRFISDRAETPDAQKIRVRLPAEFDLCTYIDYSTGKKYTYLEFPPGDSGDVKDVLYPDGDYLIADEPEGGNGYSLPYEKID